MHKRLMAVSFLSVLFLFTAFAVASRAATVTIAHIGGGVFEVRGSDFSSVAGIELNVSYDSTRLASPTVGKGGMVTGALMDSNTAVAGNIRLAVISTRSISGSGVIATITFRVVGSSPGRILSATVNLIDKNGARLSSQVRIINPVDSSQSDTDGASSDATSSDTSTASATTTTTSEASPAVSNMESTIAQSSNVASSASGTAKGRTGVMSSVEMPPGVGGPEGNPTPAPVPEMMAGGEGQPMPQGMPDMAPGDGPARGMPVASLPTRNSAGTARPVPKVQGVLERFRSYGGERTVTAYTALFNQPGLPGYRQEPPVGLSDGKSTVRLFLSLSASGNAAPNFAFSGAGLISMKKDAGNSWVIEIRPEKGINQATVTALVNNTARKYPITVAQPLDMLGSSSGLKATERDFAVFLKQRGTDKAPLYDLNRDGKRDYIDEYIFTANYIVATGKAKKGKSQTSK